MKRSSGTLAYKLEKIEPQMLLCHFGGPYWENIDNGGWSLSKGKYENNENCLTTAKREFE